MRLRWATLLGLSLLCVGCYKPMYDVSVPHVQEYRVPPDEPRFNNPPENGYKKVAPKKEFKPGMGAGGAGAGGMGGGGMMGGPPG
jgi:hypothetical protein